jgi:rubrerythrin
MRRQNKKALAEVFAQLAAAEREHVDSVTRWSLSRRGKAPDPALVRWEAPETFDAETAREIGTSRLATPYRALAMAVRNEERAFAFWSYVAAYAGDSEIKQAAEAMAREELSHVSTLRKERRRAYHKAHEESGRSVHGNKGVMQIDARALELRLTAQLAGMERGLGGAAATRTRELLEETMQMSGKAEGIGNFPASLEQRDAETISEALVDAYLEAAESSEDQSQVALLQELAERAIVRLAWLRSLTTA